MDNLPFLTALPPVDLRIQTGKADVNVLHGAILMKFGLETTTVPFRRKCLCRRVSSARGGGRRRGATRAGS